MKNFIIIIFSLALLISTIGSTAQSYTFDRSNPNTTFTYYYRYGAKNVRNMYDGFKITMKFKLRSSWYNSNIRLLDIQRDSDNKGVMEIWLDQGLLTMNRPVEFNGNQQYFDFPLWDDDLIRQSWYTNEDDVTIELMFSRGSYKVFAYNGNSPIFNSNDTRCEMGFWGLGSDGNYFYELTSQGNINSRFFDFTFYKDGTYGFQSGSYDTHDINFPSCWTINTRHDGIPSNTMADPRSGMTLDNKRNCSGSGGSENARIADIEKVLSLEAEVLDSLDNIAVYPVPARGNVTMDFPKMWWGTEVELSLVNLDGKIIRNGYRIIPWGKEEINLYGIPSGIYWMITDNGERRDVKRIRIE